MSDTREQDMTTGIVQGTHLRYRCQEAFEARITSAHPQTDMKALGITYDWGIPQSVGDQWWFLDCKGIPEELPEYIEPMELTDERYQHWTKNRHA